MRSTNPLAESQMIENPDVAKQISDLMMDMFTRLSDSCDSVKRQCSEQEYKAYKARRESESPSLWT
jgi:hypothetical protein